MPMMSRACSRSVTLFDSNLFLLFFIIFLPLRLRSVTLRIRYHMLFYFLLLFLLSSILNSKFYLM
ncbi:hypothetical protein BDV27DRAFT_121454 [Aspergillus caelatus]|uniref:Uncharacterized protein n=1 Tax=Aspergillus caelatus TaxID=61420 RepID=A0A5N7AGH1_9EURO|nr:uncharacterized protein BDV27DRAFT_121454 [Aspergillus caelatus]KAE8368964.1 hypothetical protein BDV27DRAFT_121454 [Aspergillus caelatus]